MADAFDITDGRNRYEPCSACGASVGMGLTSAARRLFVVCAACGHQGPGIEVPPLEQWSTWPVSSAERDRLAFEAWNEESRVTRAANA